MALSQNEDFTIWYLRTTYVNNVKDGLAERLISINSAVLNTPGFRAAGWSVDPNQRDHSPPIPTTVHSEYFQAEHGLSRFESQEGDEGGMVTGRNSNDTIGPGINVKRRRRKEQLDDDDSSDLSDGSDEDEDGSQRAAQQIKFARMPARDRSDSSPMRTRTKEKPEIVNTPPDSRPVVEGRRRGSSLGAVEAVKARSRADTVTSSELSSENELDPAYFQRRQVRTRKPEKARFMEDAMIKEDDETGAEIDQREELDDFDAASVDSDLSSDLGETVESSSLLGTMDEPRLPTSSPVFPGVGPVGARIPPAESHKKTRVPQVFQALPPPRPISFIKPMSLLSSALSAQKTVARNPVQRYAALSGKGLPNPLWIKIHAPFAQGAQSPFEMPLTRASKDGNTIIVAEAIGLSLWRYCEEKLEPKLRPEQLDVNKWSLRMVEDGEVDFDFPALNRAKPIADFTSNNNRGARGRMRQPPFDEFALVEATPREHEANKQETPLFSPTREETTADVVSKPAIGLATNLAIPNKPVVVPRPNLLVAGQPFGSALSNTSVTPADQPAPITSQSTPRLGVMKTVRIRHFNLDTVGQSATMEVSVDSYIAEILDHVCKKWNLDKALFVLKVAGTNTVAPLDRTVEALGSRSDLELLRRRFGAAPTSVTGSPGSASPSAPLLLDIQGPKKGKKGQTMLHPLAQKQDLMATANNFKKYYVNRKQLKSFAQSNQRVLVFDGDFLHNMPADTGKTYDANAKTNSFAWNDITKTKVSTKHSKLIRVLVRRGSETKRYDFEARTAAEAQEIVDEITKEMQLARR